jgi:hypothetical protein
MWQSHVHMAVSQPNVAESLQNVTL